MRTLRVRGVNQIIEPVGMFTYKAFLFALDSFPSLLCPGLKNGLYNRKHQIQQKYHCTEEFPVPEASGALINSPGWERAGLSLEVLSLYPQLCGLCLPRVILNFEDLTREESFWVGDLVCYLVVSERKDISFGY